MIRCTEHFFPQTCISVGFHRGFTWHQEGAHGDRVPTTDMSHVIMQAMLLLAMAVPGWLVILPA